MLTPLETASFSMTLVVFLVFIIGLSLRGSTIKILFCVLLWLFAEFEIGVQCY